MVNIDYTLFVCLAGLESGQAVLNSTYLYDTELYLPSFSISLVTESSYHFPAHYMNM